MPDHAARGIAVAAMAMHEVVLRALIEHGVMSAGEVRAIIDDILLQLEPRHGPAVSSDKGALESEMTVLRNLLARLSA